MKTVESAFNPLKGYLISMSRDTVKGWYVLEIGLHKSWVYNDSNDIGIEVLEESEKGKLLKIYPKVDTIEIDDLIEFVQTIIDVNKQIAEKENEFKDKMEQMKGMLENEAKKFYKELDDLRENSFKSFSTGKNGGKRNTRKKNTAIDEISTEKIETVETN